jgi:hypothetical protein
MDQDIEQALRRLAYLSDHARGWAAAVQFVRLQESLRSRTGWSMDEFRQHLHEAARPRLRLVR